MAHPLGRVADALVRLGVADPAFRIYQRYVALKADPDEDTRLPPAYLRVLTAGDADPEAFVRLGRLAADEVLTVAARHGGAPSAGDAALDFGCGCGRVAAPFSERSPAAFHGCDVNVQLIAWCRGRLEGDFRRTGLQPPLPYADASFALIYSHSVFTHLHETNALGWLAELARVTRPGGLAVLSLFDEDIAAAATFRDELLATGFLVRREGAEGSNLLSVYFSREGFAARASLHWRTLEIVPSPQAAVGQAIAVLQRVRLPFSPPT